MSILSQNMQLNVVTEWSHGTTCEDTTTQNNYTETESIQSLLHADGSQTTWYGDQTSSDPNITTCDSTHQSEGETHQLVDDIESENESVLEEEMRDWDICETNQKSHVDHESLDEATQNTVHGEYTEYSHQFSHNGDGNLGLIG